MTRRDQENAEQSAIADRMSRYERCVKRYEWRIVLGILVLAAALRLVNFLTLNESPAFSWHRIPDTDMHFFDDWGQRIAGGDWVGRDPLHPVHLWHAQVASAAFDASPELLRHVVAAAGDTSPASVTRELWNDWYGGPRFHQEPLYPYLIGLTYAAVGIDARAVFAWQAGLGLVVLLLIFLVARSFFGPAPAIFSLILAAAFGPLMFFETVLLRAVIISLTGLLLVVLWWRARTARHWPWFLLFGAAAGMAIQVKTIFAVFLAILGAVWLAEFFRHRRTEAAREAILVAAAFLVVLAPAAMRNREVGVPGLSLSSVSAATFAVSNTRSYEPSLGWAVQPEEVAAIMSSSGGRFGRTVVETVRTHASMADYAGLLVRKMYFLLNWYEMPNNANFYYYRLHSPILRLLPVTFTVILPFALVGLIAAAGSRRNSWPLMALILTYVVAILATFVAARFRLPLTCALIPFAGLGLHRLGRWILERRYTVSISTLVAVGALALWLARTTPRAEHPIPVADFKLAQPVYFDVLARDAESRGDYATIASIYSRALTFAPPFFQQLGANRRPADTWELELAEYYSRVLWSYGFALQQAGHVGEAEAVFRRVDVVQTSTAMARSAWGLPPASP